MKSIPIILSFLLLLNNSCQKSFAPSKETLAQLPQIVDFNTHIKPILSDRCFSCHGPDEQARKADLRLDMKEGATEKKLESGPHAFVAKKLKKSEAFQRMLSKDPDVQMPPPESELFLSEYEIALIGRWIEQGANYQKHWAFIPPNLPPTPKLQQTEWVKNKIDEFVLAKLEQERLSPQNDANKEVLLRRVSLDLTGLPPSLEELDDFINDTSPNAYEKVVDRLLASLHFGEKMALAWLDVARYADSNGYSQDGLRIMWPWRDWVIKAFNQNIPFDQFIIWQMAGDQLPDATLHQKLATGFLRNHRLNGEGGIVDEEYRVEYAADRTETTATAFLGLTLQCARCHDHKYDPISQKEYYQLFSYFNSVHEMGKSANDGNSGPQVLLTNEEVETKIAFINQQIAKEEERMLHLTNDIPPEDYEALNLNLKKGLLVDMKFEEFNDQTFKNHAQRGEFFPGSKEIKQDEGVYGKAVKFNGYEVVNLQKKVLDFDRADAFSFSFWLKSYHENEYMSVLNHLGSAAISFPGYEIAIMDGYPAIRMTKALPANLIHVRSSNLLPVGDWRHFTFSYDGSGLASGVTIYENGEKASSVIVFDKLTQSFKNGRGNIKIGGSNGYQEKVVGYGLIDDLKIYDRQLSELEAKVIYKHGELDLAETSFQKLKEHYVQTTYPMSIDIQQKIQTLRKEKFEAQDMLIGVMVMEDLPTPRATFVLNRGQYDSPQAEVSPELPQNISTQSESFSRDRIGLAQWLVHAQNPLTSRVIVNRFWQMYFGKGLVKTSEDFGNQGDLPSHPELLDWLAINFMESGWDTKYLQKLIVMSATYRQSSRVFEELRKRDPENILLSRGPSGRLSAEIIRDCVLASSGLLTRKIGGPSVKPYQPAGLWEEKGEFSQLKNYVQDSRENLYRRGLYTFWRRSSPLPSMGIFDAPARDICQVRRQETNTPLQALVLLNDPQFVEAARVLATRLIQSHPNDKTSQIINAYRKLTSLSPNDKLIDLLQKLYQTEWQKFSATPAKAKDLLEVGEYPVDLNLDATEVAALTMVCSTIMSFDEVLVKR